MCGSAMSSLYTSRRDKRVRASLTRLSHQVFGTCENATGGKLQKLAYVVAAMCVILVIIFMRYHSATW